jgi:hypothetical protein
MMGNLIEHPFADGNMEYIEARDVRILMRHEENGMRVEDLIIVPFRLGEGRRFPMHLYKDHPADLGNAHARWLTEKESSLEMAMLQIAYINGFTDRKVQEKALFRLARIKECWQARFMLFLMNLGDIHGFGVINDEEL